MRCAVSVDHPRVTRLPERQATAREDLDAVLDSTPLAVVAFVRDGHPVALPIGAARIGNELVIHGSTGAPWLRDLGGGAPASVCVADLGGVVVARSGFESSFRYRSAVLFGRFTPVADEDKPVYLEALIDTFIPGRSAELRPSTRRELAATVVLRMAITDSNWSVKIGGGWPEDDPADIEAGGWAGVVPISTTYGEPLRAPDCDPGVAVPVSVRALRGPVSNRRR